MGLGVLRPGSNQIRWISNSVAVRMLDSRWAAAAEHIAPVVQMHQTGGWKSSSFHENPFKFEFQGTLRQSAQTNPNFAKHGRAMKRVYRRFFEDYA